MSRIGQLPIELKSIKCNFEEDANTLVFKNSSAVRRHVLPSYIVCRIDNSVLQLFIKKDSPKKGSVLGLHRSLINSLVLGLNNHFSKKLILNGVGYKAEIKNHYIVLNLGYSHSIKYKIVDGVEITCPKPTELLLRSHDKSLLGSIVADLCSLRKYNPYKGKGIFPEGEFRLTKESNKK